VDLSEGFNEKVVENFARVVCVSAHDDPKEIVKEVKHILSILPAEVANSMD
jgi:hypothetical protein